MPKKTEDYAKYIQENCIACLALANRVFLTKKKQPQTIYQYSTISTFKGVIEENNLWATHWAYLNDAKELKKGIEIAKEVFSEIKQIKRFTSNPVHFNVLKNYVSSLGKADLFNKINVYVLCFSEEKDKLSLWRGYGNKYNSIATGYYMSNLGNSKNEIGTPLAGKVIYDEDRQKSMMLMYLARHYEMIEEIHEKFPKHTKKAERFLHNLFLSGI